METEHKTETHLSGETTGTSERPAHSLTGTVLAFDLASEVARLHEESAWQHGDRNAKMLVKEHDFRVVLIALRAGARMERHQAAGRISVQTLAGHLRMQVLGETVELPTGRLLSVEYDVPHDVEAREDSVFLLTMGWRGTHEGTAK